MAYASDSHPDSIGPAYLVAIVVPDLGPATAWYEKHLGFKTQEFISLPDIRIAFLSTNSFRLEVVEDKRAFTRPALEKRIPELTKLDNPTVGIAKVAFCLNDFDASANRLESEGVKFQTGIMKASGVWSRSFIVVDNNENWIQFFDCRVAEAAETLPGYHRSQ